MKPILYLTIALSWPCLLLADEAVPLILPEEQNALDAQAEEFNQAISPALTTAAKSTVRLWSGSRKAAYGTVIGDGTKILSKWSEVIRDEDVIQADTGKGFHIAKLIGVYPEEDLALLEIEGPPLTPVKWSLESPKLGGFLAAPQPDGRLAAFGVVSVLERNLRDTDLAYLGVIGDPDYNGKGVKVLDVSENSGAETAGLRKGDVILKVGKREISGVLELKNALIGVAPGDTVSLLVEVKGVEKKVDALLGNRPELQQFSGGRLAQMERMGGQISRVRDSFTRVIQTDMRPRPNQVGGPVVDLKGRVVGITMARADRTRSFIMPTAAVLDLLEKTPQTPAAAQAQLDAKDAEKNVLAARVNEPDDGTPSAPRARRIPPPDPNNRRRPPVDPEDQMRRHLNDMERLVDHMQAEMEALEALEGR
jgi:S1-C subfamily serine protease